MQALALEELEETALSAHVTRADRVEGLAGPGLVVSARGVNLDAREPGGRTALFAASGNGFVEVASAHGVNDPGAHRGLA